MQSWGSSGPLISWSWGLSFTLGEEWDYLYYNLDTQVMHCPEVPGGHLGKVFAYASLAHPVQFPHKEGLDPALLDTMRSFNNDNDGDQWLSLWFTASVWSLLNDCCQGGALRRTQKSEQQSNSCSAIHISGKYITIQDLVIWWFGDLVIWGLIETFSDQFTLNCCPCQSAACASPLRYF